MDVHHGKEESRRSKDKKMNIDLISIIRTRCVCALFVAFDSRSSRTYFVSNMEVQSFS
jgi:hypothetical protein